MPKKSFKECHEQDVLRLYEEDRDRKYIDIANLIIEEHYPEGDGLPWNLGFVCEEISKIIKGNRSKKETELQKKITNDSLKLRQAQKDLKFYKSQNRQLADELLESRDAYNALIGIKEDVEIEEIKPIEATGKHEVTPIVSFSDIHIGEDVDPDTVNGLNEYNPEIARESMWAIARSVVKIIKSESKRVTIKNIVIALLGDNITGYIHEELVEGNSMSPTEETRAVKKLLIEVIKYIADSYPFERIIIPCSKGNHGRTTKRKRFATAYKNSYEWMMYWDIKDYFELAGYTNIEFVIDKSSYTYVDIYNKTNRFCHGDHFRYGGGFSGILIPLSKWLRNVNRQINADCTFMGHWHQYHGLAQSWGCVVNGSVMGTNTFALELGFSGAPCQNIQMLDSIWGYTAGIPIYIEGRN